MLDMHVNHDITAKSIASDIEGTLWFEIISRISALNNGPLTLNHAMTTHSSGASDSFSFIFVSALSLAVEAQIYCFLKRLEA